MVQKIGRRTALKKYPFLPTANWRTQQFFYPTVYRGYYLAAEGGRLSKKKETARRLKMLLDEMAIDHVVFLGDTLTPWMFRDGPFSKQVTKARDYLGTLGVTKSFTGGFLTNPEGVLELLPHLFELTRANAISSDVHFVDGQGKIVCHSCKYGNLHISTRSPAADEAFAAAVAKSGLSQTGFC